MCRSTSRRSLLLLLLLWLNGCDFQNNWLFIGFRNYVPLVNFGMIFILFVNGSPYLLPLSCSRWWWFISYFATGCLLLDRYKFWITSLNKLLRYNCLDLSIMWQRLLNAMTLHGGQRYESNWEFLADKKKQYSVVANNAGLPSFFYHFYPKQRTYVFFLVLVLRINIKQEDK